MEQLGLDTEIMQITSNNRIENLKKASAASKNTGAGNAQIDAVAQDFEAQFISQMLQHMFSTVDKNEEFGGGQAQETYESFLVDEYGKIMVKAGGIGVADHIKRELLRFQEASANAPTKTAGNNLAITAEKPAATQAITGVTQ